jgi:hypothetical protein
MAPSTLGRKRKRDCHVQTSFDVKDKTNIKAWGAKEKRGNKNKKRLPFQWAFFWKYKKKRQQLLSRLMFVLF